MVSIPYKELGGGLNNFLPLKAGVLNNRGQSVGGGNKGLAYRRLLLLVYSYFDPCIISTCVRSTLLEGFVCL